MEITQVIIKPIINEKATQILDENKYVFQVNVKANKKMIDDAVRKLFNVSPERINVINVRPKMKRNRFKVGYKNAYKKAIITLKSGDKIKLFDN